MGMAVPTERAKRWGSGLRGGDGQIPSKTGESIVPGNEVTIIFPVGHSGSEAKSTIWSCCRADDPRFQPGLSERLKPLRRRRSYRNLEGERLRRRRTAHTPKTIVAVTACPAGIAHIYMAAGSPCEGRRGAGSQGLCGKQGANGVEDRHTAQCCGTPTRRYLRRTWR